MKEIRLLTILTFLIMSAMSIQAQTLYWEEDGSDYTGGFLTYETLASTENVVANNSKWILLSGNATQEFVTSTALKLTGYPNSQIGNSIQTSVASSGANSTKNKEIFRRIGNSSGDQTIYLAMIFDVIYVRRFPNIGSFPLGFCQINGEQGSTTRNWAAALAIKSGAFNGADGAYSLGIYKWDGTTATAFYQAEPTTFFANGANKVVIVKYTMDGDLNNGNDKIELFVSNTFPETEPTTWDLVVENEGQDWDVNSVFIRERFDNNGSAQYDHETEFGNMRITDSWDALFPSTSYSGSSWSNGIPDAATDATIESDLTISTDLVVNSLEVKTGAILTIDAGATLDIKGNMTNAGSFVVESGATLLVHVGSSLDPVTIKRNSSFTDADLQYSFIGSPVAGFDIAGLGAGYHYAYNTSDDTYGSFTGVMTPGVGFTSAGKQALEFVGVPNSGTIDVLLDNSGAQFNFVSNPYAAAIDRSAFVLANTNTTGAIYLWNDGGSNNGQRPNTDFVTVTDAGAVSGGSNGSGATFDETTYIGSAQGFLVQANAAGNVTFTEAMQQIGGNTDASYFRVADQLHKVKIEISGMGGKDQTLLAFTEKGSLLFDRMWDANKIVLDERLAFYTIMGDQKLAIQTLPALGVESVEIPLGMEGIIAGNYSIGLNESNLPEGYQAILIDQQTGQRYNLSESSVDLSLSLDSKNRFVLNVIIPGAVLGTTPLTTKMKVYTNQGELHLNVLDLKGLANLTLFDLGGRVYSQGALNFDSSGQSTFNVSTLKGGMYIVKIQQGSTSFSTKFILN
jgi:hypothetical protein